MITASAYRSVRPMTVMFTDSTVPAMVILAGWRLGLFPVASPAYTAMESAVLMWTVVFLCVCSMAMRLRRSQRREEGVMILGNGDLAQDLRGRMAGRGMRGNGEVSVDFKQLNTLSIKEGTARIVVAESDPADRQELATALIDCKLRGVAVEEADSYHERITGKIWVKALSAEWWIYSAGFQPSKVFLLRKRLLDIVCAIVTLVVTAPIQLLVAIGIKLDSKGPALFSQERVGLHGAKFTLYKFRSMKTDAEDKSGPQWAAEVDNRVTPLGKMLRKFRLDELPQAFNVLRGDMSFAGPRPERPFFVDMLRDRIPYYGLRHYVKPGITGWAQVTCPYGASVEDAIEKLQYDLYYIKHMSFRQDLHVLLKTVKVVLFGKGR